MQREQFEAMLRESSCLRQMLVELLQSSEQTLAIVAAAVARQIDIAKLESDLLDLQQKAAAAASDPTRDHILNSVRGLIRALATG